MEDINFIKKIKISRVSTHEIHEVAVEDYVSNKTSNKNVKPVELNFVSVPQLLGGSAHRT